MRRFFSPLLFFITLFLAASLILPFAASAQTNIDLMLPGDRLEVAEGRGLVVRSHPPGARVFIDGIERGRTPLRLENLIPGRYTVRLERVGYVTRLFRVTVRAGSMVDVSLRMEQAIGRVLLRIQPAPGSPPHALLPLNPRIVVDGHPHLLPAMELPAGFRDIRVQAFGWEDIFKTIFVEEGSFTELVLNMNPAPFALSGGSLNRPRFNPANAGSLGTTTLSFEASAPGRGTFTVLDNEGQVVFARPLGHFETRAMSVLWNGRNSQGEILPDGVYTLVIHGISLPWDDSPPVEKHISLAAAIDSSRIIQPLTLSSGKSGLLFAPFPSVLPSGSFQIEGSLLAGSPPDPASEAGGPWASLPFSAAFRFSPLQRLEVIAALNVVPRFEGDTGAGASGGVKWAFYHANEGSLPLGLAAGTTVSWTGETAMTPFGMASGIEFFLPASVDFGQHFSFALTPAALWTGDEGFPWDPVPRLIVSGGLMMRMAYLSTGISVRADFGADRPFVIAGGEVKIFPPPSSFVFSLMGGVWARDGSFGGFGGLGIGMIY